MKFKTVKKLVNLDFYNNNKTKYQSGYLLMHLQWYIWFLSRKDKQFLSIHDDPSFISKIIVLLINLYASQRESS